MIILGFGNDLTNIDRIQNSIDRFGQRFIDRVFTDVEQARAERRQMTRTATYAKRFAAKEAASKALGTGFRSGVFLRDIGVVNLPSGQPTLHLAGGAGARLAVMTPPGHKAEIHLTLTDDHPWAQAIVLITASPE
jgi:holo-[acyl-carrier protein] synthase